MAGSAMTNEEKALVAAMELLRKQLGDNTLAVASNTQRTEADFARQAEAARTFMDRGAEARVGDPRTADGRAPARGFSLGGRPADAPQADVGGSAGGAGGGKGGAGVLGVLGQLAGSFKSLLGAAGALATVIAQPISGFQVLGQTVKVLATAIAPVLLPATVALSGAILAVSDIVFQKGGPLMDTFFDLVFSVAIPAVEWLVESFDEASDKMVDAAEWVLQTIKDLDPNTWLDQAAAGVGLKDRDPEDVVTLSRFGGGERSAGAEAADRGMRDVLTSLRLSMGPKATSGSLDGIGKAVQMAALNADPIEQRLMKMQLDALNRIENALIRRRGAGGPVYRTGDTGSGDFSRDPGSGGSSLAAGYGEDF